MKLTHFDLTKSRMIPAFKDSLGLPVDGLCSSVCCGFMENSSWKEKPCLMLCLRWSCCYRQSEPLIANKVLIRKRETWRTSQEEKKWCGENYGHCRERDPKTLLCGLSKSHPTRQKVGAEMQKMWKPEDFCLSGSECRQLCQWTTRNMIRTQDAIPSTTLWNSQSLKS